MSQTGTKLCHLVHFIHALASKEVQTIEVFLIVGEENFLIRLLNRNNSLENGTLTILNPLSHRVQVGSEIHACGENTFMVLTLTLTVELLPPFTHEVQLRLIVHHDFNLLASLIQTVTYGSILGCGILLESHTASALLFHILSTGYQLLDVKSGNSDWEQTYRGQNRETATHIVGDDKALVAFLVSASTGSTTLCIRYSHDDLLGKVLAPLILALLLQQTECQSGFSSCSTL